MQKGIASSNTIFLHANKVINHFSYICMYKPICMSAKSRVSYDWIIIFQKLFFVGILQIGSCRHRFMKKETVTYITNWSKGIYKLSWKEGGGKMGCLPWPTQLTASWNTLEKIKRTQLKYECVFSLNTTSVKNFLSMQWSAFV